LESRHESSWFDSDSFPDKRGESSYGYIETPDGREIYFHANSVLNNRFKSLKLGSKVSFAEEAGEKGPQASSVHLITRARAVAATPPAMTRATKKQKMA
jgi:cold shock CspA family protein